MTRAVPLLLACLVWAAPSVAADAGFGLDLKAGPAAPATPVGPDSFSQNYGSALASGLAVTYRPDPDWAAGLEGRLASFGHKSASATGLDTWSAGLLGEWDLAPESIGGEHFYLQAFVGGGGATLRTDALLQSRQWTSAAARLGLGWERPLLPWLSLLAEADGWGLLGPGKADAIGTVGLDLGLRFGLPTKGDGP